VYEKAHRVSEDVTIQHGELKVMNKDMKNHPYLSHSKEKFKIIKAHILHLKISILHMTRERDVRVLNPKGLVGTYLGTQDLATHKCTQLIMRVSKIQNFGLKVKSLNPP
jgi:hypothetical protein